MGGSGFGLYLNPQKIKILNRAKKRTSDYFYVQDNGMGFEKNLDTIFRIFKRLHASNKYGGGTGAGLTIIRKL